MASWFQIHLCATRGEMGLLCCECGEAFDTKLLLAPACSTLCFLDWAVQRFAPEKLLVYPHQELHLFQPAG